jgi:hypothetical protein
MMFWPQCLRLFLATKSLRNLILWWADVSLNTLFNSIKSELICLSHLKMVLLPQDYILINVIRWRKSHNRFPLFATEIFLMIKQHYGNHLLSEEKKDFLTALYYSL